MAKIISDQQRLEAFALYTMATQHYRRCREFEAAASEILGVNDDGFNDAVSDGIYGNHHDRPAPFEEVLKRADVIIKTPKKSKR